MGDALEMQPAGPTEKAPLTFGQIWNACFGFLGIQIGFELQNVNVSRIFQTLGAEVDELAILWIAAPLTGLIVQPLVGHFSDHTWTPLGRRRPYFLAGAILAALALFVMPNSPALWVAVGMLWVMDASLNITMEPFRAFVGDIMPDRQRTTGYAMQSVFIGAGAVGAASLPWVMTNWLGISNTAAPGEIPASVTSAFYVGGACLFAAVLWTVLRTKEYSPAEVAAFAEHRRAILGRRAVPERIRRAAGTYLKSGLTWLAVGLCLTGLVWAGRGGVEGLTLLDVKKEVYVIAGLIALFGLVQIVASRLRAAGRETAFTEVTDDLFSMPKTMKQLAVVQFFSWFGLFAMWIYATPAVAAYHFGTIDPGTVEYQDAADWWGVLSSIRNGTAVFAAFGLMWLSHRVDRRRLHALCLTLGAVGFASMLLIGEPSLLWLPMIGVGCAWAAIVAIPYSILAGALPPTKMGVYMGIFNIFIVVPQLVAATLLGFILSTFFASEPIWALAIAAGAFIASAGAVLLVDDVAEDTVPLSGEPLSAIPGSK